MEKFFARLEKHYHTKPESDQVSEYKQILIGYHEDQLNALAGDCIKTYDRFPSVAGVYKILKASYEKPHVKTENPYDEFGIDFKTALQEAMAWHKEISNKDFAWEKYKNPTRCLCVRPAIDHCINEILAGIHSSEKNYSKFNLTDWKTILALGWQHNFIKNHFDRILDECVKSWEAYSPRHQVSGFKDIKILTKDGTSQIKEVTRAVLTEDNFIDAGMQMRI